MAWRSAVVLGTMALALPFTASAGAVEQQTTADGVTFESRPDIALAAPTLTTNTTGQVDPGLLLTTPGAGYGGSGAAIYDNSGQLVWYAEGAYNNLHEITWQGEPALAVHFSSGGQSEYQVLNSSYQEVASFSIPGMATDLHDMKMSPDGSRVLLMSYVTTPYDLRPWGGSANAQVINGVVQEIDLATNQVTFEWDSLEQVPIDETTEPLTAPFVDWIHINSLAYDTDGSILIGARNTSTVYKVDHDTGDIIWRFGGERSDFTFPDQSQRPSYQHDALRLPDGRLSAFDNGNGRNPSYSRGSVWELDETAMTARLVEDLQPNSPLSALYTGSNRLLDNGNHLVDYGNTGEMVEFVGDQTVFTASLEGSNWTYRAERSDWVGTPTTAPDVAWSEPAEDGTRSVHMSWNGATEVESWRIEAGDSAGTLSTVETVARAGFETDTRVSAGDAEVYRISALDAGGTVLDSRTLVAGQTPTISE
ncbi:arylsulfotransferase family protein [Streptomyces sp. B6B3]|uniref:arylsulfotransferase family protein n=1 Tax=Streptomyces sp. B6B3 TaxID=3153570 RepID=UPI00325E2AF3